MNEKQLATVAYNVINQASIPASEAEAVAETKFWLKEIIEEEDKKSPDEQ